MITFCPRCGAEFPIEVASEFSRVSVRCPGCRLALTEVPPMLAPSEDEIGYEVDDWSVGDRGALTAALAEADIPYRWDAGLVLVVPAAVEADVDRLVDSVAGADAAEAGDTTAGATDETVESASLEDGVVDDEDEGFEEEEEVEDGGEEAQAAMADIFVAADRLQHAPFDKGIGDELATASEIAGGSLPPYGIDAEMWQQIQRASSSLVARLESAEEDEIVSEARALRDFLRDYV